MSQLRSRLAVTPLLPSDTAEGDWIEISPLGAYGACLRTAFNGLDRAGLAAVRDAPMPGTAADVARDAWPARLILQCADRSEARRPSRRTSEPAH